MWYSGMWYTSTCPISHAAAAMLLVLPKAMRCAEGRCLLCHCIYVCLPWITRCGGHAAAAAMLLVLFEAQQQPTLHRAHLSSSYSSILLRAVEAPASEHQDAVQVEVIMKTRLPQVPPCSRCARTPHDVPHVHSHCFTPTGRDPFPPPLPLSSTLGQM